MAHNEEISTYTALDIEKYQKGLLSPAERHQMEKAALEDPFLADAMEGYALPKLDIPGDLAELKRRLAEKQESKKVVPITSGSRSFPWLRVAAVFFVLVGSCFLVYRFAFNKNQSTDIAQQPVKPVPATLDEPTIIFPNANDTANATVARGNTNQTTPDPVQPHVPATTTQSRGKKKTEQDIASLNSDERRQEDVAKKLEGKVNGVEVQAPVTPSAVDGKKAANDFAKDSRKDLKELNANALKKDQQGFVDSYPSNQEAKNAYKTDQGITGTPTALAKSKNSNTQMNVYRGRVVDEQNNPLPFANVTNNVDDVGTYSDAQGNFVLTSPDTVLNVQVRSLGFDNNNLALQRNVLNNRVVMENDNVADNAIVVSRKKVNSERSRNSTIVFDQPEPIDGWDNYDAYLANNLKEPATLSAKEKKTAGEVELSFDVNQYGEPINIKVVRSLCSKCDEEAIRLLKTGPRWKPNKKKGTVTVSF